MLLVPGSLSSSGPSCIGVRIYTRKLDWPGTLDISTTPDPRSFHVPHCFGLFTLEIGPQTLRPEVSDRKEVWLLVGPGLLSEVPEWLIPDLPLDVRTSLAWERMRSRKSEISYYSLH